MPPCDEQYGISPLTCAGGIYGTRAQVRLQRSILKKALGPYGRLLFISDALLAVIERVLSAAWKNPLLKAVTEKLAGASLQVLDSTPHVHRILQGIPTDYFVKHAYYRSRRRHRPGDTIDPARDDCGLIWFAPILPFTSTEVLPFLARARKRFEEAGLDFWVAILLMNPRSVTCLMNILYDKDDFEEAGRAEGLYSTLLADMQAGGYQQYRAGLLAWPKMVVGADAVGELNARIKTALDPAGTLAPGRYGIG